MVTFNNYLYRNMFVCKLQSKFVLMSESWQQIDLLHNSRELYKSLHLCWVLFLHLCQWGLVHNCLTMDQPHTIGFAMCIFELVYNSMTRWFAILLWFSNPAVSSMHHQHRSLFHASSSKMISWWRRWSSPAFRRTQNPMIPTYFLILIYVDC